MATLVLGTIGRVFGGPVGGLVGTVVGGFVDRAVLGGRSGGSGRPGNLTVQSAAYGEAIPVVTGRMRVAGNLLWTTGIVESAGSGGKRNGTSSSSSYYYTASFAVGLSAGPIAGVGRVWADGRLIRGSDGAFISPTVMRIHAGSEGQPIDPLIAAAEGPAGTPAYRGVAYAVFEDLALVDFGNRIPNLTFEVIADAASVDMGTAIRALAIVDGRPVAMVSGAFPPITGHFAGGDGSIAENLAGLLELAGGGLVPGQPIEIIGGGQAATAISLGDRGTRASAAGADPERQRRLGGETRIDSVEISYFDVDRDYQLGLQRASRGVGGIARRQMIGAAMSAVEAKTLAETALSRAQAARVQTVVGLPWRYLGIRPGTLVRTADDETIWRVRQMRFEAFVVHLELERAESTAPQAVIASSGRALAFEDAPPGPTSVMVVDLPLLPGEPLSSTRLWVAAAGASPGWRQAMIEISLDGGISYAAAGSIGPGSTIGRTLGMLPDGPSAGWDRFSAVAVELLSDRMWLEGRPEASVLAGANLAMIGDELVQFTNAEAIAPRVFRLSGLLRGRRGTEGERAGHRADEPFLLIDQATMLTCALPGEMVGGGVKVRPVGGDDGNAAPTSTIVSGLAARPLSPVHLRLRLRQRSGEVVATWIRRSRDGYGWADFVDAPLAEATERYVVEVRRGGSLVRQAEVGEPRFVYTAAMQAADGGSADAMISVRQLSAQVGPGAAATADIELEGVGETA
jgi:hypothetical protein